MITKPNSIERTPRMLLPSGIPLLAEPVASVTGARAVLFEDAVRAVEPPPGPIPRPKGDQTGQFWEALSYVTLWLCGWIGIGLCFL